MKSIVVKGPLKDKRIDEAIKNRVPYVHVKRRNNGYSLIKYDTDTVFTQCTQKQWEIAHQKMYSLEHDHKLGCDALPGVDHILGGLFCQCLAMELFVDRVDVKIINPQSPSNKHYHVCGYCSPEVVVKNEDVDKAIRIVDRMWYSFFGDLA